MQNHTVVITIDFDSSKQPQLSVIPEIVEVTTGDQITWAALDKTGSHYKMAVGEWEEVSGGKGGNESSPFFENVAILTSSVLGNGITTLPGGVVIAQTSEWSYTIKAIGGDATIELSIDPRIIISG